MLKNTMQPVRRDLDFKLPANRINDWHYRGVHTSTFFNTMSLFFPVGERFFIHSVRHYRDRIKDPELQKAVAGFIGQEAMHGREHEEYNEHAAAAGLPVLEIEKSVGKLLEWTQKHNRPAEQLAATVALEHLTSILADIVLREPRVLGDSEAHYRDLWTWHALEETEHKAVAFDVYVQVMGKHPLRYFLRTGAFVVANVIFWTLLSRYYWRNLAAQGQQWNLRGWLTALSHQWGSVGVFRRVIPAWFSYFKPGFHPWDHDNRAELARLNELNRRYAAPLASAA